MVTTKLKTLLFGRVMYIMWKTPTITGKGHFVITFDAVNYTYSVTPATAYLYMAGAANGWKQIDAMASPEYNNVYKGYMYLNQEGFKFCSEENWNGTNYGADFSTAADAANIMMTEEAGFYQVVVDLNEKTYTLTPHCDRYHWSCYSQWLGCRYGYGIGRIHRRR